MMLNWLSSKAISVVNCGTSHDSKLITNCNLQRISKYTEIIKLMLRMIIGSNIKLTLQNFGKH